MDRLLRFSDYDVFAYIASGAAALALTDLIFATQFILGVEWSVSQGLLTIVATYVLGHIIATPSAWLIERVLVRKLLKSPSENLMGTQPSAGWRRFLARTLLGDFYTPFDIGTRSRLQTIMAANNVAPGEPLFWLAFPEAKTDPIAYGRMVSFLNLYGFSRNMAFVLIAGGLACIIASALGMPNGDAQLQWGPISMLAGFGMFHRYLKFYRLYAVEVLTTFAAIERRRP